MDIEEPGVALRLTCNGSPVQYQGTVDGHPAYFRARWSGWSFTIARIGDSAVWPKHPEGPLFESAGRYDDDGCGYCAGMMPNDVAERLMIVGIGAFRAQHGDECDEEEGTL